MKKSELEQLIREAIQTAVDEAVYPEGFNVEEFKALPSYAARMKYVKARLPKVAQGSARAVFIVDNTTVLKVAMNEKGKAQNDVEADVGRQNGYPVAKVFEVGDGGAWIEMEKAEKATPKVFKQLAGVDLKTFEQVVRYYDMDMKGENQYMARPANYDDLVSGDNELINDVLGMMADYNMPGGDIGRISSWGVVNRGKPTLVMIDFGLTQTVWDDYYAPKRAPTNYARPAPGMYPWGAPMKENKKQ